jgi:hypothetical protein
MNDQTQMTMGDASTLMGANRHKLVAALPRRLAILSGSPIAFSDRWCDRLSSRATFARALPKV